MEEATDNERKENRKEDNESKEEKASSCCLGSERVNYPPAT
jgi:hypothetical protein